MKNYKITITFCVLVALLLASCNTMPANQNSEESLSDLVSESQSNQNTQESDKNSDGISTDGLEFEQDVRINIYSYDAYLEIFKAVSYSDKELEEFLLKYPESYFYSGITSRKELMAFVELLYSAPLPEIKNEDIIQGFGLEYRVEDGVIDVIYVIEGQRYRFCFYPNKDGNIEIDMDSNATLVTNSSINGKSFSLYKKDADVYFGEYVDTNYTVNVILYDDIGSEIFHFDAFENSSKN